MAQDLYQYEKMVERALRGVVREALARASREGLRGAHHFYIGFATDMPGVVDPRRAARAYPAGNDDRAAAPVLGPRGRRGRLLGHLSFQKQLERLTSRSPRSAALPTRRSISRSNSPPPTARRPPATATAGRGAGRPLPQPPPHRQAGPRTGRGKAAPAAKSSRSTASASGSLPIGVIPGRAEEREPGSPAHHRLPPEPTSQRQRLLSCSSVPGSTLSRRPATTIKPISFA